MATLVQTIVCVLLAALVADATSVPESPERLGDYYVTEGDILLTQQQYVAQMQRKIMPRGNYTWPRNNDKKLVIYYLVNRGVRRSLVHAAAKHWMTHSCVHLREIRRPLRHNAPYLNFIPGGGCASAVGLSKQGANDVILSTGCPLESVIHEIGHKMGFVHEQSRPDRDSYITVIQRNVIPNMLKNFYIYTITVNYSVPYDYSSIMHYDSMAFSNGRGPTILTKDPIHQEILGEHFNHGGLSFMDAKIFNIAYRCIDDWEKLCPKLRCLNDGYVKKSQYGKCGCVCPNGTSGKTCETKTLSYNDAILAKLSPNSKKVTKPIVVRSIRGKRFTKVITAPACHRVLLRVHRFNLYSRFSKTCYFDYLQIRRTTSTSDPGQMYCGRELRRGSEFVSKGRTLIVHIKTLYGSFHATTRFVRKSGCSLLRDNTAEEKQDEQEYGEDEVEEK